MVRRVERLYRVALRQSASFLVAPNQRSQRSLSEISNPPISAVQISLQALSESLHHRSAARMKKAMEASEMAGQELDRLGDSSASDEERRRRKRRLIKGPKEFRDIRRNRPKG
jgi:hypothetical protein